MARNLVLILFLLIGTRGVAQKYSWEKSAADKIECRKFKHNFYRQIGFTASIADYGRHYFYGRRPASYNSINYGDTIDVVDPITYYSIASFEYGLRYNLLNVKDNFSISFNLRPSGNLCVGGITVASMFTLPIGFDFNFFNHSTFNNTDDNGFSLGGGIKINRFPNSRNFDPEKYLYLDVKNFWMEYYVRFEAKYRKYKYRNNNSRYGYTAIQFGFRPREIQLLNGQIKPVRDMSVKIIFGKILNY